VSYLDALHDRAAGPEDRDPLRTSGSEDIHSSSYTISLTRRSNATRAPFRCATFTLYPSGRCPGAMLFGDGFDACAWLVVS
jgi:hypothetical protein